VVNDKLPGYLFLRYRKLTETARKYILSLPEETPATSNLVVLKNPFFRRNCIGLLLISLCASITSARGEAMLELFQLTWPQITQKMPEIAEAGYDSLWLPNPCKGNSGGFSIGYDVFDPFDLGNTNQQGTVATKYGTQAQLLQMVQTAHRFGIRVYFDNVMNHRSSTVPGYPNSGTPTTYYPYLTPQDFHLQTVTGGYNNWPSIGNPYWCTTSVVENQPLLGLCDLANEPGTLNYNFGNNIGNTITKPSFIRSPNRPDLYMDTNGAFLGAGSGTGWPSPPNGYGPPNGWRPFDGTGQPVPEDVSTYLCRAVAWTLYTTKCDGFRLDAVKHTPVNFFGNETGQTNDAQFGGYTGAIQAMYDYVHGYGSNVTANGYNETDGNRNSLFNTEAPRNDAMIFGEYEPSALPAGEDYADYLNSGMRLLNQPLYIHMNNAFQNNESMSGMDQRDFTPSTSDTGNCDGNGNFSGAQAVNFPQTQDGGSCCPANEGLENAYFFMHEGLPMVYSDGFNHNTGGGTPIVSYANYLGEFGDNSLPDIMYLHNQLSRGGTQSRWSDQNIVAFERYDYREGNGSQPQTQVVSLLVMNDKTGNPADISFDDGVTRTSDGYYLNPTNTTSTAVSNSRGLGLAVSFAPGSVLVQSASSSSTGGRAYKKLLVHGATSSLSTAQSTANNTDPTQRLIYVGGQTITSGGGAIELTIPTDSWVIYAYQWPEPSRANPSTNSIVFRQGGAEVPHIAVYRTDGPNGDTNYNPLFPFKMRGGVDSFGNVITGANISNLTYAIDVPVLTNAPFDILVRSDASCSNTLVKLDGGIDLNSQMGLGPTDNSSGLAPTNFLDFRDNKPGYTDDVFVGYEQTAFQFRNGPEKFAARNIASNNIVSLGAETYYYTVDGGTNVVSGSGYGAGVTNQTANWVYHDPGATNTALVPTNTPTQRVPFIPTDSQPAVIYVEVGYQFQINTCYIYYTTDGSNPEGAFGIGKGTTQVVQAHFANHDSAQNNIDWWAGTIPGQPSGTQVRYKVAGFSGGSAGNTSIAPISDAEPQGSKYYGLNQAAITNFDPTAATVWLHNDLNPANTVTGLQTGFHVIRARTFLPRQGMASAYNTILQTFYYDGALPTGVIASPAADGNTLSNQSYTIVIQTDSTATEADVNIQDGNPSNDDVITGQPNGNGNDTNGNPVFVAAKPATPSSTNFTQEFHFNYANVPTNGVATITVRLKEHTSSLFTNRFTTLTRTVSTRAPSQIVHISNPQSDSDIITMSQATSFPIQTCFTSTLDTNNVNLFSIYINGTFQPRTDPITHAPLYLFGGTACGAGMRLLTYNWSGTNATIGTNQIQVVYTNGITLSDTRNVIVAPPLVISGWDNANQLLSWASAPGVNYMVLATTNLQVPFAPISDVIPSQGASTVFFDNSTSAPPQKFYEVEAVTNSP
jgi:glycosidase